MLPNQVRRQTFPLRYAYRRCLETKESKEGSSSFRETATLYRNSLLPPFEAEVCDLNLGLPAMLQIPFPRPVARFDFILLFMIEENGIFNPFEGAHMKVTAVLCLGGLTRKVSLLRKFEIDTKGDKTNWIHPHIVTILLRAYKWGQRSILHLASSRPSTDFPRV